MRSTVLSLLAASAVNAHISVKSPRTLGGSTGEKGATNTPCGVQDNVLTKPTFMDLNAKSGTMQITVEDKMTKFAINVAQFKAESGSGKSGMSLSSLTFMPVAMVEVAGAGELCLQNFDFSNPSRATTSGQTGGQGGTSSGSGGGTGGKSNSNSKTNSKNTNTRPNSKIGKRADNRGENSGIKNLMNKDVILQFVAEGGDGKKMFQCSAVRLTDKSGQQQIKDCKTSQGVTAKVSRSGKLGESGGKLGESGSITGDSGSTIADSGGKGSVTGSKRGSKVGKGDIGK